MSAQPAANPRDVVERSVATGLIRGDDVSIQVINPPTSDRMRESYMGHIEGVLWKSERVDRLIVRVPRERTPSVYENTLTFVVVDELPDDWKQKILRRRA